MPQKQKARSTDRAFVSAGEMPSGSPGGFSHCGGGKFEGPASAVTAESRSRFCQVGFSYFFICYCPLC
ncbi:hypothetical protein EN816_20525 [Mesorhizobium sp. M8A.F.Ca.ET.173.01.1.1]|nr:hypothetical protein EN816_20525 [Mesorhizobium sp. M8A.F.Ca.ET.173.01.1.1]